MYMHVLIDMAVLFAVPSRKCIESETQIFDVESSVKNETKNPTKEKIDTT